MDTLSPTTTTTGCSSSSTVEPKPKWKYDLFMSFRGEDTRKTFVDHLYAALDRCGIYTFKDDQKLERGKSIPLEILRAIEESRFSLVIFSENYAKSSWCLDELVKIMECRDRFGQVVYTVFYGVDPSEVRGLKRSFTMAFELEEEKMQRWRNALNTAASISGWDVAKIADGHESKCIQQIVLDILGHIKPHPSENLIGMDSRVQKLMSLIGVGLDDVRMIGIWGMGGIGKTTIARAMFHKIYSAFEGSSFVENVRENGDSKLGIKTLQQKILSDILMDKHIEVRDCNDGFNQMRRRLSHKRVLLVLDDVDDAKHIESFAATREWFGTGSRIIVTTRDEHLLSDAQEKYKPDLLRTDEAIKLFTVHAFKKNSAKGYEKLLERAVRYASHLPLALKVLGSFLCDRGMSEWESALDRLDEVPDDQIIGTLKLSFDGLTDYEQKIFLDIACFFKGGFRKHVTRILDSFGYHAVIGISVLIEKSLLTVSESCLQMHDLIQEMGWHIVRKSFPNSRLWLQKEIYDVMAKDNNLGAIEALKLDVNAEVEFGDGEVFRNMKNLRLLYVDSSGCKLSCKPTYLTDNLRWLHWNDYQFDSLPTSCFSKLVGLEMLESRIQHLWNGNKILHNLKFIKLFAAPNLTSFPDISGAPNLVRLSLGHCYNLVEVHPSVGVLKKLILLDLSYCDKLENLPSSLEMNSLEVLNLSRCTSLKRFPDISVEMRSLARIHMDGCKKIKELPLSIRFLARLTFLDLSDCLRLQYLPNAICELKHMEALYLSGCSHLMKSPENVEIMEQADEPVRDSIDTGVGHNSIFLFHAVSFLCSLRKLSISHCLLQEDDFPDDLRALFSLEELNMSFNNNLKRLPASICHLSQLKALMLDHCGCLEEFQDLPSGTQVLIASECPSLQKVENLSEKYEWLCKINLRGCHGVLRNPQSANHLDGLLHQSFFQKCAVLNHLSSISMPGNEIPYWFSEQEWGSTISLKLPSNWHTKILGFVICGVFKYNWEWVDLIKINFKIANCPEVNRADLNHREFKLEDLTLWIGYISFDFFQRNIYNDDFHPEYWSRNGNYLVINISADLFISFRNCGVHVLYKEDVQQVTLTGSPMPDFWSSVRDDDHYLDEDFDFHESYKGSLLTAGLTRNSDGSRTFAMRM